METILLLEDDLTLSREISKFFKNNGFLCEQVYDGSFVKSQLKLKPYSCLILDINVPGTNGIEVCREIRAGNHQVPILMLTAFGEVEHKVKAFTYGADDYLVKPFHFDELLVRIRSLLRRKEIPQTRENLLNIGDLQIDTDKMKASLLGEEIVLSPKEFKLLTILARAGGRVLSKNQIAIELWDDHIETNNNTIEVYINFLRKKIDKNSRTKLIHTKIGYGYYMKPEPLA